jgi:hypothetical protein
VVVENLQRARAARLKRWYRERGRSPRTWLCHGCGEEVDSLDLEAHLQERHG